VSTLISPEKYGEVMTEYAIAPRMIESSHEYLRSKQALERLLFPERKLLPEEDAMAKLLLHLVDVYEQRTTTPPASTPRQVLRHLMSERQLKQTDLAPVFGTASVVSEVLNGKRQINAKQARKLADYFQISTDIFL
jgi:HTH-type transcriptional regulator/antitoxin HigA